MTGSAGQQSRYVVLAAVGEQDDEPLVPPAQETLQLHPRRVLQTVLGSTVVLLAVLHCCGVDMSSFPGVGFSSAGKATSQQPELGVQLAEEAAAASSDSCERCPKGHCDRQGGSACFWFEDQSYHCEVEDCLQVPSGGHYSKCWHFAGKQYFNVLRKQQWCDGVAEAHADDSESQDLDRNATQITTIQPSQGKPPPAAAGKDDCERCPVGRCDRQSGPSCIWFSDSSYHCRVSACAQVPSGHNFGACWIYAGQHYYDLPRKDQTCHRVDEVDTSKTSATTTHSVTTTQKTVPETTIQPTTAETTVQTTLTTTSQPTTSQPTSMQPTALPSRNKQGNSLGAKCERCPQGRCHRHEDGGCMWFANDHAYHCEVDDCTKVPNGAHFGKCWMYNHRKYFNVFTKEQACRRHDEVPIDLEERREDSCERCPVGTCGRDEKAGGCKWFADKAYHCKVDRCDQAPIGEDFGRCWAWQAQLHYNLKDKHRACRLEDLPQATAAATVVSSTDTTTSTVRTIDAETEVSTEASTTRKSTFTVPAKADASLADEFPEVSFIFLPDTELDQKRAKQMKKEAELWIPGGKAKVRQVEGVNPKLWPSAGNYDQVDRWCSTLEPNADLGATGEKWWTKENREVEYAELQPDGTPAMPNTIINHVGCTLSHFITWMDARSRNLPYMVVAESDGTPSYFATYAGFIQDFQYVVTEIVKHAPEGWDIVLLDKCRMGAVGGPVRTLFLEGQMKSAYHVYKWLGRGWAGAALYMVSKSFLDQVPQMVHDYGLFMVDSYLDWRCQEDLKCFSVCADAAPYNTPAFG